MKKVSLNISEKRKAYEIACRIYSTNGQEAVELFGEILGLDLMLCEPCEAETPVLVTGKE